MALGAFLRHFGVRVLGTKCAARLGPAEVVATAGRLVGVGCAANRAVVEAHLMRGVLGRLELPDNLTLCVYEVDPLLAPHRTCV